MITGAHEVLQRISEQEGVLLSLIPMLPLLGAILLASALAGGTELHQKYGRGAQVLGVGVFVFLGVLFYFQFAPAFWPVLLVLSSVLIVMSLGSGESIQRQAGWMATIMAAGAFLVSVFLFLDLGPELESIVFRPWTWIAVERLRVEFGLRMDVLSGVMSLVVTGVGSLIHLYAIGYMEHDENRIRFFCYLNIFLFAMLLLVLGDNLLVMFVGWEGVGVCSYLLIGFWYEQMPNANAGQKAFVVNRIGDAGFLLGMFTLFLAAHTLSFKGLEQAIPGLPPMLIETAAFLLFIGAIGKSAQIPLYVWLPDAMAGPTPVSALIHAATMVTAGVYMIARMSVLYAASPHTLLVISVIGALTAFFAATIALAQNDIKRVLAYSTVSQLGYMFMALGAGAFSNGIYHLVTHAFFKAMLFMAAGSVIVGCHHEQDMRHFGGLWKKMFVTFLAYLFGTYAIVGLPPGSGFYSKDAILWAVYSNPGLPAEVMIAGIPLNHLLWVLGVCTAFLTAFYMTRSLALTFFGSYRGHHEAHESPWTMLVPLIVLIVPSMCFALLYGESLLQVLQLWTRTDLLVGHEELENNFAYHALENISQAVAYGGVALGLVLYIFVPKLIVILARIRIVSVLHEALINKWWIDEFYQLFVLRPLRAFSEVLFNVLDCSVIDGLVNGSAALVAVTGDIARKMQTGRVSFYALVMFAGSVASILLWMIL